MVIIFSSLPEWGSQLRTRSNRLGAALVTLLGVAFVAGPGAAVAQSPTDDQYDPTLTQVSAGAGGGGDGASEQLGSLPFTGLDLVAMVAAAVCLTALGIVLYRRNRRMAGGHGTP